MSLHPVSYTVQAAEKMFCLSNNKLFKVSIPQIEFEIDSKNVSVLAQIIVSLLNGMEKSYVLKDQKNSDLNSLMSQGFMMIVEEVAMLLLENQNDLAYMLNILKQIKNQVYGAVAQANTNIHSYEEMMTVDHVLAEILVEIVHGLVGKMEFEVLDLAHQKQEKGETVSMEAVSKDAEQVSRINNILLNCRYKNSYTVLLKDGENVIHKTWRW